MFTIPVFLGQPLFVWLGVLLLTLLTLQVLSGARVISIPFVWHRRTGYLIFLVALAHGYWALGLWFFGFKIG